MTQLREEWGESEFARRVWPDGGSEQRQKTTNDGEKVQTSERANERPSRMDGGRKQFATSYDWLGAIG